MKVSLLSNETNSQDPMAVHSRIFVGNLNTFQCSKSDVEQIFQRYGHLTAISMHKGYAFVQFSNHMEAKSAVDGEDGRLVLNQNIDVNLVSQPKQHQQVATKHVFQSSGVGVLRHQSHTSATSALLTTTAALKQTLSPTSVSSTAAATTLFPHGPRNGFHHHHHLMVNGATVAASGGGGVVQPKLSVAIQKRSSRKRRRQQLNRIRSEFLLDNGASPATQTSARNDYTPVRMSPSNGINLMLMGNTLHPQYPQIHQQHPFQYSEISPTLSPSSSSASSTSSLDSLNSCSSNQQVPTELPNYHLGGTSAATGQVVVQHHQQKPQQRQWPSSCYANINNNYLIPTPVYDIQNEVIDDGGTVAAVSHNPQQPICVEEEDSQEVVVYDANNNPLSSWEEFILTTNKSGPVADRAGADILICGNCRELFNLEQLLEHRKTTCQLRVFCKCMNTPNTTSTANPRDTTNNDVARSHAGSTTSHGPAAMAEDTILFCRMCRKQFSHPLELLQHVQHVHQIKIFETEHDYREDKDLASTDGEGGGVGEHQQGVAASSLKAPVTES